MSSTSYLQHVEAHRLRLSKLRHPGKAIEEVVAALLHGRPSAGTPAGKEALAERSEAILQDVNTLYMLLLAQNLAERLGRSRLAGEVTQEVERQLRTQARLRPYDLTTLKTSVEIVAAELAAATGGADPFLIATGLRDGYEELLAFEWDVAAGKLARTNVRRRRKGAYYTPLVVARAIAARTLEPILSACTTPEQILALKIIDPMMGAGVFLHAAGDVLTERAASLSKLPPAHWWPKIATHCLHGVDLDADAVRIGRISLAFLAGDTGGAIACVHGNALIGTVRADVDAEKRVAKQLRELQALELPLTGARAGADRETLPAPFLSWARAFPAVFQPGRRAWDGTRIAGGFDALLANPPYVSYYSRDSAKRSAASLEEQYFNAVGILDEPLPEGLRGRTNLFLLALYAGEQLLARNIADEHTVGRAGWLLPDTFLSNESYAEWRRYFLERRRLEAVEWVRVDLFGEPSLGSSVIYLGATQENTISVDLHAAQDVSAEETGAAGTDANETPVSEGAGTTSTPPAFGVEQAAGQARRETFAVAEILQFPHLVIPTMPRLTRTLVARIENASVPVTSWMNVRDGVNPGPRDFRDRIMLDHPDAGDPCVRPLIVGGDIDPYRIKPSTRWLRHDPRLLTTAIRKQGASFRAPELFSGPKLVSRQTASHPIAALDLNRRSAINSVHIMIPNESLGLDPHPALALVMILGCLNAGPVDWYYRQRWMENRRVFPQVHISSLRQLPIPTLLQEESAAGELIGAAVALLRLAAGGSDGAMDHELETWLKATGAAGVANGGKNGQSALRRKIDGLLLTAWGISAKEGQTIRDPLRSKSA